MPTEWIDLIELVHVDMPNGHVHRVVPSLFRNKITVVETFFCMHLATLLMVNARRGSWFVFCAQAKGETPDIELPAHTLQL